MVAQRTALNGKWSEDPAGLACYKVGVLVRQTWFTIPDEVTSSPRLSFFLYRMQTLITLLHTFCEEEQKVFMDELT